MGRRRVIRSGAVTVLAAVVLSVVPGAAVGTTQVDADLFASETVTVNGQPVPVAGHFVYRQNHQDGNHRIGGLVHGVRRVDGGTVLYFSMGAPAGEAVEFLGGLASDNSLNPYQLGHTTDIRLLDTDNLVGYRPLFAPGTTFTSSEQDFDSRAGELRVGYAVFPELPADVDAVSVVMPFGTAVGDVPVEDGPLEPVGDDPAPLVGEGWPALPTAAELADADPAAVTSPLTKRSGDLEGKVTTEQSAEQVAATLDANVLFAHDSADLSPEAAEVLAGVAADIAARGTGEVVVTGHTDSEGSSSYNQTLSEQRAASVLAVLQPQSGDGVTFRAVGRGEGEPVATNETDEGRQQNRRVTVVYAIVGESS